MMDLNTTQVVIGTLSILLFSFVIAVIVLSTQLSECKFERERLQGATSSEEGAHISRANMMIAGIFGIGLLVGMFGVGIPLFISKCK